MSEFSSSYHIRTESKKELAQKLRRAGYAGVIFGPSGGWSTFVPYSGKCRIGIESFDGRLANSISEKLGETVLHYFYAEDFGWGFSLSDPDGNEARFSCWWYPSQLTDSSNIESDFLLEIINSDIIRDLLKISDSANSGENSQAYRFAKALRLPAFRWLSPDLAQRDTIGLLQRGGMKVGTKPRLREPDFALPSRMRIKLRRSDLSAREAFSIVNPYFEGWKLCGVSGEGALSREGYCRKNGRWKFYYYRGQDRNLVYFAYLFGNGNLGFGFEERPSGGSESERAVRPAPLSDGWIDSADAAASVLRSRCLSEPEELVAFDVALMTLDGSTDPQMWIVDRISAESPYEYREKIGLDAKTGQIRLETFERHGASGLIEVKVRRDGGEWEDWPLR